ncbi:hypothetical protein J7643_19420 [bacterium]|nr:hypothetical protein [bacterium]
MLPLWFWLMLWVVSTYWLVRVVGKPIIEAGRAQRLAAEAAAQEAAAQAAPSADEGTGLTPLWIHLEGLTLGLQGADVEALYGTPELVEQPTEETERWRYPMTAEGEDGQPVTGTLVLEFERGKLTGKAFEQIDSPEQAVLPSETEAPDEASVPESEAVAAL